MKNETNTPEPFPAIPPRGCITWVGKKADASLGYVNQVYYAGADKEPTTEKATIIKALIVEYIADHKKRLEQARKSITSKTA
jgi:hypothetical protein